ncbi:MAG: hypothetical protein U5N58_10750 [Actinomycetota bacterium]|nr:hypothetical protein [Actinomycetota bacterium]
MVQSVRKMIMANHNKIKLVLRRAGIAFVDTDQEIRKNIYLDYIQRITQRRQ